MNKILLTLVIYFLCLIHGAGAMEVTSEFGWREHPIYGDSRFHTGIDLGCEYGTPITAFFNGKVLYADWWVGYGNCVVLDHGDNVYTLYGHCDSLTVYEGDYVNQGQVIGYVGSTGDSTGPHLHLEYWVNGEYVDPMVLFDY